jgi:cargo-transport protein YPP1
MSTLPPEKTNEHHTSDASFSVSVDGAASRSIGGQSSSPSSSTLTPDAINRLAARDRAYNLLSSLTKLGSGWDCSEAWFALARAYEEGGQVEKAKEVLWWCVELEDTRPLRLWRNVGRGGLVLL